MATKLFVKDGKMLVTNGKLRQCCCGPVPSMDMLLSFARVYSASTGSIPDVVYHWAFKDAKLHHNGLDWEGNDTATTVTQICGTVAGVTINTQYRPSFSMSPRTAGLVTYVDLKRNGVTIFSVTTADFMAAPANTVFTTLTVAGGTTFSGCVIPDTVVTMQRGAV